MSISFYTSRVVLNTLGIDDFGIYGVVGGVVALFHVINGTLRNAVTRFITFEVGKGAVESVNRIFSLTILIYLFVIIVVLILGETIGLWFISTQMNFPECRMTAIFWVYQISLIIFCIDMIKVPLESIIISYEKFNFFSILGVVESILYLMATLGLTSFGADKLITYSFLMLMVSFVSLLLFYKYSIKTTTAARYIFFWSKEQALELISFIGWSLLSSVAIIGSNQGVNIIINIFLGVTVNAAVAIANQVNSAVFRFVTNFQTVFTPQITKSVAKDDIEEALSLVYLTSKLSYYLLMLFVIPLFFCLPFLISKWLIIFPEHTIEFAKIILLFSLIDSLAGPLYVTALALGKVKPYQLGLSLIVFLNLPIIYILLSLGFSPVWVFIVKVIFNFVAYIFRILYLRFRINFSIKDYAANVAFPVTVVTIASIFLTFFFSIALNLHEWNGVILFILASCLATSIVIFLGGTKKSEREFIFQFFKLNLKKSKYLILKKH